MTHRCIGFLWSRHDSLSCLSGFQPGKELIVISAEGDIPFFLNECLEMPYASNDLLLVLLLLDDLLFGGEGGGVLLTGCC